MLVRGAADPFVSEEVVAAGAAPRFAGVRTVAVEQAGHWPHLEQPAVVAGLVDEFLARQVRGDARRPNTAEGVHEQGWTDAFVEKTRAAFADALAPDVRLEAPTLYEPIEGRDDVEKVMAAASTIYESDRPPTDLALAAYERALKPMGVALVDGGHFDPYLSQFDTVSGAARAWFREHLS